MGIFLSIEETRNGQAHQLLHYFLEAEESIAFSHSPEVLTVFIGEGVEYQASKFVHSLTVGEFFVGFEEDVYYSSNRVEVVSFFPIFGEMNFVLLQLILLELVHLNLEFFPKKSAVGFCSLSVLLNHIP